MTSASSLFHIATSFRSHLVKYDEQDQRTFVEYYDLAGDPWQLDNVGDLSDPRQEMLSARLQAERRCAGETCP